MTGYGNGTNFKVLILPLLFYFRSPYFYRALIYINIIFQTYYDGKTINNVKEIKVYISSISISSAIFIIAALSTMKGLGISLTTILCKLFEHIITSAIMNHYKKHNLLYSLQIGFRDKRSCESQLIGFIDDIVNMLQGGNQTDVIVFRKLLIKQTTPSLLTSFIATVSRGAQTNG